jgi:integrase
MAPFLRFKDENGQPMRFHSHMLRDTYAVELLLAGYSIEDVSYLLTHTDIRTTQKHYAPWVKSRCDQLDAKLAATFAA